MKLTENDIQALKAQEAKDLAIQLLKNLQAKEKAPISAGEAQLQELQYELKLKEAESEDNRQRESHEKRMKELELQIAEEKSRQAEASSRAQEVREEQARLLEQVQGATESLSIQLERATREHNVKIEQLDTDFRLRSDELKEQLQEMEEQRDGLLEEINSLADIRETAEEIGRLREMIEASRKAHQQELQQIEVQVGDLDYEKTKKIHQTKQRQELELAELETQHKKDILRMNQQAADEILASLDMVAVKKGVWEQLQTSLQEKEEHNQQELADVRTRAQEELRKQYNITAADVIDITDLYYREQGVRREAEALRGQLEKMEAEIKRMREHIEQEPQRIATTVEAAKAQIQNFIGQGAKR